MFCRNSVFHCSGFALFGKATQNGVLYHGRILDYMIGIGLDTHHNLLELLREPSSK